MNTKNDATHNGKAIASLRMLQSSLAEIQVNEIITNLPHKHREIPLYVHFRWISLQYWKWIIDSRDAFTFDNCKLQKRHRFRDWLA